LRWVAAWDELSSYLRLGTDELAGRARQALAPPWQERCGVCLRLCKVDRLARQVGPLVVDADGLARRGLLLRHLVMPGMLAETEAVLRFVPRSWAQRPMCT
jgi:uncharacterized Fe-S radical SAM superfamily protein PflX